MANGVPGIRVGIRRARAFSSPYAEDYLRVVEETKLPALREELRRVQADARHGEVIRMSELATLIRDYEILADEIRSGKFGLGQR